MVLFRCEAQSAARASGNRLYSRSWPGGKRGRGSPGKLPIVAAGITFYTLLVHPLNGRVRIENGYITPRVDEAFDDEGNVVE